MRTLIALCCLLGITSLTHAVEPPVSLFVEGYAGGRSYRSGEEAAIHVSTSAPTFNIEVSRLGAVHEVVWKKEKVPGTLSPIPEDASANGCQWPVAIKVPIDDKWRSGYYEVKLMVSDNGGKWIHRGRRTAESIAYFIVRAKEPGKTSSMLLQVCTNTYNAYNNWGGFSLYAYNGLSKNQGHRVSFHRPGASQFARWELPFIVWCEENGYPLEYAANEDLEIHPEILSAYKLVLSVGHDEYWSAGMRDNLEAYIGKGGNVAFFSGNSICWQVRPEDDGNALVCWKQNFHSDPIYQTKEYSTLSSLWSHHLVKRPENNLTGVGFLWGGYRKSHGQFMDEPAAYTVHRPEHWVFAGTHVTRGLTFGDKDTIVGYECDGCELEWRDGLPYPTHRDGTPKNFEVLATCPAKWHPDDSEWYEEWEKGRVGNAVLGVYQRGGTVFTTGSTDWSHGLRGKDPIVERVTKNIFERLGR